LLTRHERQRAPTAMGEKMLDTNNQI